MGFTINRIEDAEKAQELARARSSDNYMTGTKREEDLAELRAHVDECLFSENQAREEWERARQKLSLCRESTDRARQALEEMENADGS